MCKVKAIGLTQIFVIFPGLLHHHRFCCMVSVNTVAITELMVQGNAVCTAYFELTSHRREVSAALIFWLDSNHRNTHVVFLTWGSYCLGPYTNEKKLQTCTSEVFIVGTNSPASVVCAAGCLHCFHKSLKAEDENLQLWFDFDFLFYKVQDQTLKSPWATA